MNIIKTKKMIYLPLLIVASVLMNPVYAKSILNFSDAINKAGKQRMLTQKMLKDYTLLGMNNKFGNPAEDLKQLINLFDMTLNELDTFNKNAEIKMNISKTRNLWLPVKQKLEQSAKIEVVVDLHKELDELLESSNKVTELLVKTSGLGNSKIINISGRQRMLSQRLAALYMLQVWGINDPKFKHKLHETMDEFSKAQKTLQQSDLNTPEINTRLAKVKKLYMWFEIMGKSTSGRYIPSLISKSSDKILSEMNSVTNLYTQAVK